MASIKRSPGTRRPWPCRRAGFSLVEVLVGVFVLSIGMMSIGSLQVTSKRANLEAMQRSTAAMLAQDQVERMRVNPEQLAAYISYSATGTTLTGANPTAAFPTGFNCGGGDDCSHLQLAGYDLILLNRAVAGVAETSAGNVTGGLAQPTACIRFVGAGAAVGPPVPPSVLPTSVAGEYEVAIAWRGLNKLSEPANTCGEDDVRYDDPAGAAGNGVYRRVFFIRTFIDTTAPTGSTSAPGT
jgi:type IV pilus assembly protein PilV